MEQIIEGLLQDFEQGKMNRRQLIKNLAFAAASVSAVGTTASMMRPSLAFGAETPSFKAVGINHISIQAPDHAKQAEFYSKILGLPATVDKPGESSIIEVGETLLIFQDLGVRHASAGGGAPAAGSDKPGVDHVSYTIAGWDTDPSVQKDVLAYFESLGLPVRHSGRKGKSVLYTVLDPNGMGMMVGGKNQLR
jgi:catechol 2,3-dioxygenase-like lactoylglutathione lyase family enzyme